MTERRRWKAEEKPAIIKDVKENGKVVETCRKYSVDPGMHYKWKESCDTFGLDGLKPHYRRMETGMRKIMKENEKLKRLLAEKDLENALLSDALKKKMVRKQ
jgi:transposase-like protein